MSEVTTIKPGDRFGRWTVISSADPIKEPSGYYRKRSLCKCDCGTIKVVSNSNLKGGVSTSCGCARGPAIRKGDALRHGEKLYGVWLDMRCRCQNSNDRSWKNYGGRGISVCEEWEDYNVFRKWSLENGYRHGLTIDRIDNDGDYCPENCRWTTRKVQGNNTRRNTFLTVGNETHTLSEWADITGISVSTISWRARQGMSPEKVIKKEDYRSGRELKQAR